MVNWADHKSANPLAYIAMIGFDHERLGLPSELPGTGEVARALIDAGAPVDGLPDDAETPLMTAASYGDVEVARALIDAGADIDARARPDSGGVPGATALMHAAVFGMTDVLDLLVSAGGQAHGIESAAAIGDISNWLTPDTPLQARIRALIFATDHQRLNVIDELINTTRQSTRSMRCSAATHYASPPNTDGRAASNDCCPTAPTPSSPTSRDTRRWISASRAIATSTTQDTTRSTRSSDQSPDPRIPEGLDGQGLSRRGASHRRNDFRRPEARLVGTA